MKKLLWVPAIILALGIFGCQDTSGPGVEGPIGANEMDDDVPGFYGYVTEAGTGDPIVGADIEIWCRDCPAFIMGTTSGTGGYYEALSLSAYSPHFGHSVQLRAFADGYEDFYSGEDLACPGEPVRYDIEMEPID